jgi:hypothetical protein
LTQGDLLDVASVADVGVDGHRLGAVLGEPRRDLVQRLAAARSQDQLRPLLGGQLGRRQTDPARGPGDDDDLFAHGL